MFLIQPLSSEIFVFELYLGLISMFTFQNKNMHVSLWACGGKNRPKSNETKNNLQKGFWNGDEKKPQKLLGISIVSVHWVRVSHQLLHV